VLFRNVPGQLTILLIHEYHLKFGRQHLSTEAKSPGLVSHGEKAVRTV
jgi:hypothetical protein